MTEPANTPPKAPKDRSPSFPFIPLKTAIERLEAFDTKFGRHPTPASKAGLAWGMKEKSSQADQTVAALKSFGLVKYDGMGAARHVSLTDEGRAYLRAQQQEVKNQVMKVCALRPKIMRQFWAAWGPGPRPVDEVALDELVLKYRFSDFGARNFLKVYDETIAFAGLSDSDKVDPNLGDDAQEEEAESAGFTSKPVWPKPPAPPSPPEGKVKVMAGERELTTGLLSKDASFRLIVSGQIGVKEIERLIKKLELDKEILAEQDADGEEPDFG